MKIVSIAKNGELLIREVELAMGPLERMRGLLGRVSLGAGRGMYLAPCSSIHTCFMRFSIDVFFLDRSLTVTKAARHVRPFRIVMGGPGASAALELEAGWLPDGALATGDRLTIIQQSP